jgi:hypothetical protein
MVRDRGRFVDACTAAAATTLAPVASGRLRRHGVEVVRDDALAFISKDDARAGDVVDSLVHAHLQNAAGGEARNSSPGQRAL